MLDPREEYKTGICLQCDEPIEEGKSFCSEKCFNYYNE